MLKRPGQYSFLLTIFVLAFHFCNAQSLLEKAEKTQNVDSAIFYAEQHLSHLNNKDPEAVTSVCFLAQQLMTASRYVKAEKLLLEAMEWPVVLKNEVEQAHLELVLGDLYKYKVEYSVALTHYLSALEILNSGEYPRELMTCYIDLAEFYRALHKMDKAANYIDQAFTVYKEKELSDVPQLVRAYHRAAAIANESGEIEQSIAYSRQALILAKENGMEYAQATAYNELGYSFKNSGELDSALQYYMRAEELFFKIKAYREAVHTMNNRVMLYAHRMDSTIKIIHLYKQIIDTVNHYKLDYPLVEVYRYLHLSYLSQKDTGAAYQYFNKYHDAVFAAERKQNDIDILNIIEKYENQKVKKEMQEVSNELDESHKESTRMLIFLITSGVLVLVIGFLAFRLNTSNHQLKARNKEKDTLIKEIHHRVKNNLQIMSSLLELQTKKTEDPTANAVMMEAQNRVKTMALIHKKLYQNDDLEQVDFQSYLEDLCAAMYQMYGTKELHVQHEINANGISFDVDTAVPLGLIVNELVTNAYKYAFQNITNPKLWLKIDAEGAGTYTLTVSDNGPGLSEDIAKLTTSSLGLRLVGRLAKQLSGTLNYTSNEMNNFIVTFQDTMTRKQVE